MLSAQQRRSIGGRIHADRRCVGIVDTPKGWSHSRRHFIAVQLDGAYRLKALVPVLETLVAQVQRDPSVGIGLVSMLGFEDTAKTLKVRPCRPASWNVDPRSLL